VRPDPLFVSAMLPFRNVQNPQSLLATPPLTPPGRSVLLKAQPAKQQSNKATKARIIYPSPGPSGFLSASLLTEAESSSSRIFTLPRRVRTLCCPKSNQSFFLCSRKWHTLRESWRLRQQIWNTRACLAASWRLNQNCVGGTQTLSPTVSFMCGTDLWKLSRQPVKD